MPEDSTPPQPGMPEQHPAGTATTLKQLPQPLPPPAPAAADANESELSAATPVLPPSAVYLRC